MSNPPSAKGSQHNMREYVSNTALRARLETALRTALPTLAPCSFAWLSPLQADGYRELQDAAFWKAIDRVDMTSAAREWWPSKGGPVWDAVGVATADENRTIVLIEAKAHPREFVGSRLGATAEASITLIHNALAETHRKLGSTQPPEAWHGPHYQLANRLAWTEWLRQAGQPAVFAYVAFADDLSHIAAQESELTAAANGSFAALGLDPETLPDWCTSIVLPAAQAGGAR